MPASVEELLPDALLERIRGRAAGYDEANSFFHEDFADLAEAGYLKIFVPAADGGLGYSGWRRRSGRRRGWPAAAPATALAVNMHLVWTGVARVLQARGDNSLDFVLGRGRPRRGLRASAFPRPATTRSCSTRARWRRPATDGGYEFTGTQDLHQPVPGVDPAGHLWPGRLRRGTAAGAGVHRPRQAGLPDQGRLEHAGNARQPVQHHRAGRRGGGAGPDLPEAAGGPQPGCR